jgi:hypothetical protein
MLAENPTEAKFANNNLKEAEAELDAYEEKT